VGNYFLLSEEQGIIQNDNLIEIGKIMSPKAKETLEQFTARILLLIS
jgi:hypothetical protein